MTQGRVQWSLFCWSPLSQCSLRFINDNNLLFLITSSIQHSPTQIIENIKSFALKTVPFSAFIFFDKTMKCLKNISVTLYFNLQQWREESEGVMRLKVVCERDECRALLQIVKLY